MRERRIACACVFEAHKREKALPYKGLVVLAVSPPKRVTPN